MPKVTVDPQRTTIPSSGQLLQLNQTPVPVPVPQANSSSLHWRQQASPSPLEPGLIDRFRFVSTARPLAPSVPQSPRLPVGMVVRTRFPGSPPNFDQRAAVPNYISNLYPNPALAPRNTFVRHSSPFGQQLNSSPRQQPAVSNIQPVTPRGRYAELIPIPISTNDFVNKSLNLISGDVLENQGNFKPALDRDQADGTCRTLHDHQLPPNSVDRRTNDGFSASLAETLNSMRISGDIVIEDRHFERVPDSTESHVTRHSTQHQEASGVSDGELQHTIKERRNGKDILEHFSTPPNVQNIADKSMVSIIGKDI